MAAKYAYSHICSVCGRDYYASGTRICKRGRLKGKLEFNSLSWGDEEPYYIGD